MNVSQHGHVRWLCTEVVDVIDNFGAHSLISIAPVTRLPGRSWLWGLNRFLSLRCLIVRHQGRAAVFSAGIT